MLISCIMSMDFRIEPKIKYSKVNYARIQSNILIVEGDIYRLFLGGSIH